MANHVFQHSGTSYNKLRRSERFNLINVEPIPLKRNRNFARVRTESVPLEAPAGSGSLYPADNNSKQNVNGKQRAAAAAARAAILEVRRVEESVKEPRLQVKKTRNRRSSANFVGKDSNKTRGPANSTYFINTRSTQRSEIAIFTSHSISSYYTSLVNEDLVIPTKSNKKRLQKPSPVTTNLINNKSGSTIKGKLRTERLKKVTKRQLKRKQPVYNSARRKVRFEAVLAYEFNAAEENNTSEVTEKEDSESEAEQVVPVSHKSFFERSVEGFCQIHPAFNNATQRCLNRLKLIRSTIPMNSPASPTTPAVQTSTMSTAAASTTAYQHQYISPTTAAFLSQAMTTTTATSITNSANSQSGKRKHSDDTALYYNDHNYPINNNNHQQSTTPPGHLSAKQNHYLQPISNQSVGANQFSLSPRSWIFQTPDKQKQSKLPPPSTVHEENADDGYGGLVPVMLHHNKRLKTVYSFDESTVVDLMQGGGGEGGLMEVHIDSDRLAPICQISTTDDGADCEFETSSISPNISSNSTLATAVANGLAAAEEQNQFQLQTHELSLDFSMSTGDSSKKRHRLDRFDGEIEEEGAFLDQWVRMNAGGGSANQSPLRVLQHMPTTTTAPPKPLSTINHYLRTIHNVATQRPTKTLARFDRRQYLERKSLTFEENGSSSNSSSPGGTDTPKVSDTSRWRLRALKQKATSVDSIGEASDLGSARKRSMDLFNAGRGDTIRDLRDISETITSGAYELESGDMSHEQENIMPPSRMRLLLGNLQMNDSVDINYDRPLYPRRNY